MVCEERVSECGVDKVVHPDNFYFCFLSKKKKKKNLLISSKIYKGSVPFDMLKLVA